MLDPAEDWARAGVTFQAFQYHKAALRNGLSSRAVCGESGPMHLVQDALGNDARLVPLLRLMADYADASARGAEFAVHTPQDADPFGKA